ncbi:MAG: NarK/NasA family nitrate transporter [Deltaproteobacteria bacterium]|nr:NarK/NasA family nitrate transporter [Deltaproteobacteria bacterium]
MSNAAIGSGALPLQGSGTWLTHWAPEDTEFWAAAGARVAWRKLAITTAALMLSFATWFMVSALVVRLPAVGFRLSTGQLFWLAAMPGLAGGTLRILHTFMIPIFGSRHVVSFSTLLLLVPALGWGFAVQNTATPYWILMLLAFAAGFGGGIFSSVRPRTSLFFPKRLPGTARAMQAGLGNLGVSLTQLVTPWIITAGGLAYLGAPQTLTKNGASKAVWLQNAALWYVPLIVLLGVAAWSLVRSVPVRANFREQFDIFREKHTWFMTSLYIMTFGTFSGASASFPLLIKELYGKFPNAPDPLTYAFLGPLIGSLSRVAFGPLADRIGGGILTAVSGAGVLVCSVAVTFFTGPESMAEFPWFVGTMLALFFFSGIGNASTFRQMPVCFPPRQASGVIGWTAAVAAYGPFFFAVALGTLISTLGSPNLFFYGLAAFCLANVGINWWYYTRPGAEKPC